MAKKEKPRCPICKKKLSPWPPPASGIRPRFDSCKNRHRFELQFDGDRLVWRLLSAPKGPGIKIGTTYDLVEPIDLET